MWEGDVQPGQLLVDDGQHSIQLQRAATTNKCKRNLWNNALPKWLASCHTRREFTAGVDSPLMAHAFYAFYVLQPADTVNWNCPAWK
jgi:hypothetical protein